MSELQGAEAVSVELLGKGPLVRISLTWVLAMCFLVRASWGATVGLQGRALHSFHGCLESGVF